MKPQLTSETKWKWWSKWFAMMADTYTNKRGIHKWRSVSVPSSKCSCAMCVHLDQISPSSFLRRVSPKRLNRREIRGSEATSRRKYAWETMYQSDARWWNEWRTRFSYPKHSRMVAMPEKRSGFETHGESRWTTPWVFSVEMSRFG